MSIPKLTKSDIEKALKYIDENGIPEKNKIKKYEMLVEAKKYPPKYVVAVANHLDNGTDISNDAFNSIASMNLLKSLGFEIHEIDTQKQELSKVEKKQDCKILFISKKNQPSFHDVSVVRTHLVVLQNLDNPDFNYCSIAENTSTVVKKLIAFLAEHKYELADLSHLYENKRNAYSRDKKVIVIDGYSEGFERLEGYSSEIIAKTFMKVLSEFCFKENVTIISVVNLEGVGSEGSSYKAITALIRHDRIICYETFPQPEFPSDLLEQVMAENDCDEFDAQDLILEDNGHYDDLSERLCDETADSSLPICTFDTLGISNLNELDKNDSTFKDVVKHGGIVVDYDDVILDWYYYF